MKHLLTLLLLLPCLGAAPSHPNVLIILADHLGYGDVQCYNPEGKIPTPNIDRLASQSMRFTDAHSAGITDTGPRYALLTGRYPFRSRIPNREISSVHSRYVQIFSPGRLTIASFARQFGYRTACIGKWHLGWEWPIPLSLDIYRFFADSNSPITPEHIAAWQDIFSKPIPGGPLARGFDSFFGVDVPAWPPYCFIENDRTVGIPSEFLPRQSLGSNRAALPGPAVKDWDLKRILPTLGDRAAAFITTAAKDRKPFLLYLPLTAPNLPIAVNEPWAGKSTLDPFADLVMETDDLVGRVLDALEKSGAADNTLVLFTSIGPSSHAAQLKQKGHHSSGPFRGREFDAWEGGHRVPFLVRFPGVIKPGTVCPHLVHHADLLATLAALFSSNLPARAGEDSFNILPLLRGSNRPVRPHAATFTYRNVFALRQGPWKLILGDAVGTHSDSPDPATKLYNLDDDPGETNNLALEKPPRVADMKALMEKLIRDGRSTPGPIQPNDTDLRRYLPK